TNGLGASQLINIPPVALPATYTRSPDATLQISIANLLTNYTSDADSDARGLVSVGAGKNGAAIAMVGNWIFYAPSDTDPNRNTSDHFDYTIGWIHRLPGHQPDLRAGEQSQRFGCDNHRNHGGDEWN